MTLSVTKKTLKRGLSDITGSDSIMCVNSQKKLKSSHSTETIFYDNVDNTDEDSLNIMVPANPSVLIGTKSKDCIVVSEFKNLLHTSKGIIFLYFHFYNNFFFDFKFGFNLFFIFFLAVDNTKLSELEKTDTNNNNLISEQTSTLTVSSLNKDIAQISTDDA